MMRWRNGFLGLLTFVLVLPAPVVGANLDVSEQTSPNPTVPAIEQIEPIVSLEPTKPTEETVSIVENTTMNNQISTPPADPTFPILEPTTPPIVDPEPTDPPNQTDTRVFISKVKIGLADQEFVEIYNPNQTEVDLSGWQLQFLTANFADSTTATKPTRVLKDFKDVKIEALGFYVIGHESLKDVVVDDYFDSNYSGGSLAKNGSVRLIYQSKIIDLIGWNSTKQFEGAPARDDDVNALQRCLLKNGEINDTDNNQADFLNYENMQIRNLPACVDNEVENPQPPTGNPDQPEDPDGETTPEPKNTCHGLKLNEIGANLSEQFIEVRNDSDKTLDLKGCRLMTNRSKVKFHEFGDLELDAGGVLAVELAETDLTLTKTTTGTVFLLDELGREIDEISYEYLAKETSWSLIDGKWLMSFETTPNQQNIYLRWPNCEIGYFRNESTGRCNKIIEPIVPTPCRDDQYRSEETGRCRNIELPRQLTPCKEGQYRSEETNRCRSIALAAQVLKPCADDQFRNPATGRCKKIASDEDVLKECAEGFERNPDTNRCRKILAATAPIAPFKPEQVATVAGSTLGWWVLGGVSLLALGYGAWEWRWEISRLIRRVRSPVSTK